MRTTPLGPGASLARISATPIGWIIDCRSSHTAQHFDVSSEGEAAELALMLRDQGGWTLRFSPAAEAVRRLVDELTDGGMP